MTWRAIAISAVPSWRDEPGGRGDLANSRVADYKENRYYVKRRTGPGQRNIALSFYWWPGDAPLQGAFEAWPCTCPPFSA